MKKRPPGELMLKMLGMMMLVAGVIMAFTGAGNLALVFQGDTNEIVQEYLKNTGLTFGQMGVEAALSAVAGMIYLSAGIIGVKNAARPEKANQCIVMGCLLILEIIIEAVHNMQWGQFEIYSIVGMMLLPGLYLWGAVRNKNWDGYIL